MTKAEFTKVASKVSHQNLIAKVEAFGGKAGAKAAEKMTTAQLIDVCYALALISQEQPQ